LLSFPQVQELSREEVTGGFSGAELIAICREAALYALEDCGGGANIGRKHLLRSIESTKRQITPEMLTFYASYQQDSAAS
jgi:SpoVK/Ycf46/Vps4 family AAA+-type ATPase